MPNTGRELPYSLWLQSRPAPLVFILPGIGAHRTSRNAAVLAELAFDDGFSVVTVSSPFHPEFLLNGLTDPYPGYTPNDAEDIYTALSLIHEQIVDEHPGMVTSTSLAGYSLGGIETLHIAAAQRDRPPGSLRFERFVALNPPVDLRHAAQQFDRYFDAPLRWPAQERDQRVKELAMKAFLVLQEGIEAGKTLPLDRTESEFLIGLQGRTMLVTMLEAIRERTGQGLRIEAQRADERGPLHYLLNESTLQNYGDQLLVPHYRAKLGVGGGELERAASLRSIAEELRRNDRIQVLTNADDFIVTEEALGWLRGVMGERLTIFPSGGHLGNLHLRDVQSAVSLAIRGEKPSELMGRAEALSAR